jgi:hypothetical protein
MIEKSHSDSDTLFNDLLDGLGASVAVDDDQTVRRECGERLGERRRDGLSIHRRLVIPSRWEGFQAEGVDELRLQGSRRVAGRAHRDHRLRAGRCGSERPFIGVRTGISAGFGYG